ncbi:hypothetical protein [Streptococcus orisasini]|uniref:hypothetical protein n=1 Tax=Streptococcus orisasini TaxID=1080071 RepID=UPI001EE7800C|nr:hypothetical protein [Streptococcus orisasini]
MRNKKKLIIFVLIPLAFYLAWLLWPISKCMAIIGFILVMGGNALDYLSETIMNRKIPRKRFKELGELFSSKVAHQLIFAAIFLLLTVLSCYKATHVKAVYSIIIFSAVAVISFILFILLLWGIKYVRQAHQSSKGSDD